MNDAQLAIRPAYRESHETDFMARSTLQEKKKVANRGGKLEGISLYNQKVLLQKKYNTSTNPNNYFKSCLELRPFLHWATLAVVHPTHEALLLERVEFLDLILGHGPCARGAAYRHPPAAVTPADRANTSRRGVRALVALFESNRPETRQEPRNWIRLCGRGRLITVC